MHANPMPVLAMLLLAGCGVFDSTESRIASAERALAAGEYGEAVIVLRNVVDDSPGNPAAQVALARALHMAGDDSSAERVLMAAAEKGADPAAVAELQALWKLDAGQAEEVLAATDDPEVGFTEQRRRYFRARALQALHRVPEAMVIFRELATVQPASADLQLRMAQGHAFHGRSALAMEALEKALSLQTPPGEAPVVAEAWLLRANLAQQANDLAAAQDAWRKALEAAPGELTAIQQGQLLATGIDQALRADNLSEAQRLRAMLVRVLPQAPLTQMIDAQLKLFGEKSAEAVADLQLLVQKIPENPPARALLVSALLRTGAFEQALKEANTLVAAAPPAFDQSQLIELLRAATTQPAGSARQALALASAQAALQQPALARQMLEEALQEHPDDVDLKMALVRFDLGVGRHAEALELAAALKTEDPADARFMRLHADALAASGDTAGAVAEYEALWKAYPSASLALLLADARHKAGVAGANQPLMQWLEKHPRDVSVRLNLAIALQQAGDVRGATREFALVAAEAPPNHPLRAIALNNLAWSYYQLSDPRALETARQAYEGARGASFVQDTYGWLLADKGRVAEALPLLKAAAEGAPASATIRYHYASALASAGSKDAARVLLEDILLAPDSFEGRAEAQQLLATLR